MRKDGRGPRHRRRRVHRQQLRALRAADAPRLARHHARQAHLRRAAREPARRDGRSPPRVRARRHRRRRRRGSAGRTVGHRGALRRGDPRRPVAALGGRLHPHRRRGHLGAARSGAPRQGAGALHPDLHRRGLRLGAHRRQHRDRRAEAAQPVRGQQGRRRSPGLQLLRHLRAADRHHSRLEQLRAVPVSREGHPALRHQRHRRPAGAALRRRRATCATGCTWTTTAGRSIC